MPVKLTSQGAPLWAGRVLPGASELEWDVTCSAFT